MGTHALWRERRDCRRGQKVVEGQLRDDTSSCIVFAAPPSVGSLSRAYILGIPRFTSFFLLAHSFTPDLAGNVRRFLSHEFTNAMRNFQASMVFVSGVSTSFLRFSNIETAPFSISDHMESIFHSKLTELGLLRRELSEIFFGREKQLEWPFVEIKKSRQWSIVFTKSKNLWAYRFYRISVFFFLQISISKDRNLAIRLFTSSNGLSIPLCELTLWIAEF